MIVAAARLTMLIPGNDSLKGKRKVVKSLIEKARHKFDAALAEVGDHDLWQKTQVGIALVGNDPQLLDSRMQQIAAFIESQYTVEIIDSHLEFCYLKKE